MLSTGVKLGLGSTQPVRLNRFYSARHKCSGRTGQRGVTVKSLNIHYRSVDHKGVISKPVLVVKASAQESPAPTDKNAAITISTLKRTSWISFWIQLALSLASTGIFLFTLGNAQKLTLSSTFVFVGVAASLVSTAIIRLVLSRARSVSNNEDPPSALAKWDVSSLLLRNMDINLIGMACTIFALQGEVGLLVAKTLTSSSANPYTAPSGGPAAIDIFSVQASANVLLAHFCSIFFLTFLLRVVSRRFNAKGAVA